MFLHTRDAGAAGSALVGGIRPLLKRGSGGGLGCVMPYVVVGLRGEVGGGGEKGSGGAGGQEGEGGGMGGKVLGVKEGECLAKDCGAVGYVQVDVTTGAGLDAAVRALVLAMARAQGVDTEEVSGEVG